MPNPRDVRPVEAALYFLPIQTRMPLKFGPETLTEVTCARVRLTVEDRAGRRAVGWGETPLSVQWVWPSSASYAARLAALQDLTCALASAWASFDYWGHPLEIGHAFTQTRLDTLRAEVSNSLDAEQTGPIPHLAALVCSSAFDLALYDAYGQLHKKPVFETFQPPYLNRHLETFLEPAADSDVDFTGRTPAEFLTRARPDSLVAWHLVGGKDPLEKTDLTGAEPSDGYPVLLADWIKRDGLTCLKVKLTGTDPAWDYDRLVRVGTIAIEHECLWLSADFNCTVTDPTYVNEILDRLLTDHPRIYGMILYVEQPFPYELSEHPIDVRSVVARKPLFMDESAHDWRMVKLGRSLGWSGVALKTCKTLTGAILSLCWARAHGMTLMVQDLTNPMLAQIPHVLLAAHAGTIMGVETNAMQFYPEASSAEANVHAGLYQRRQGRVELGSLNGSGFGYQIERIHRTLPEPAVVVSH